MSATLPRADDLDGGELAVTMSYKKPTARELYAYLTDIEDVRRWLVSMGCTVEPFWEGAFAFEAAAKPHAVLDEIGDAGLLTKRFPFAKLKHIDGEYCVIVAKRPVFNFSFAQFAAAVAAVAAVAVGAYFKDDLFE